MENNRGSLTQVQFEMGHIPHSYTLQLHVKKALHNITDDYANNIFITNF